MKRDSFLDNDEQIMCFTEQRMGYHDAIRIFNVHRDGDGTVRACIRGGNKVEPNVSIEIKSSTDQIAWHVW